MTPPRRYDFGRNWRRFVDRYLDQDRVAKAARSLQEFLGRATLKDVSFLDVGCGSGLHSLAAHRMRADRVVSVDLDPESVACCEELRSQEGSPDNWSVHHGSALDGDFMEDLGRFDVVYAWGSLHHTGAVWEALEHAAARVKPGGVLFLAIYNKAEGVGIYPDGRFGSSRFWALEKRIFVALPRPLQRLIEWIAAGTLFGLYALTFRNPRTVVRDHREMRGMAWNVYIRDWLGGYPYEYASVAEVFDFMHGRLGFQLEQLTCSNSLGNNQYLFRRPVTNLPPPSRRAQAAIENPA